MNATPPTLLITGFGPFPGTDDNPSAHLVQALADRHAVRPRPAQLVFALLPTDWRKIGPALNNLFNQHIPDRCVHLGYAACSTGFRLESTAYNETCEEVDVAGVPGTCGPVLDAYPARLISDAPLDELEARLSASRLPVARSQDPGRYLCNMAYYLSMSHNRSALFIHIPAIKINERLLPGAHKGDHHLPLETALDGMELVIDTLTAPS